MTLPTSIRMRGFAVTAALAAVWWSLPGGTGNPARAQTNVPADLKLEELKTALEFSQRQLAEEKKKTAAAAARNGALAESLAETNRLLESERAEHEELMLRMASLGVDLLKPDPKSLEQRLLHVVRDLERANQDRETLVRQLARLGEAAVHYLENDEGDSRERLETELVEASRALGPASVPDREKTRALGEGRVVSIDPEIGVVVLNIGKKSGVRVGMPLRILRDETLIGTAMVVDVRDAITGAVLQRIATEGKDVKVGDRIEPETERL